MRSLLSETRNWVLAINLQALLGMRRLLTGLVRHSSSKVRDYESSTFTLLKPSDIALSQADNMDRVKRLVPASFIEMMNYRTKKKKLGGRRLPEWELNNKARGTEFSKNCDQRVPEIYQRSVGMNEIKWRNGSVIKPVPGAGSEGVYCYRSEDNIFDILGGKKLKSRDVLFDSMRAYIETHDNDRWIVEELIEGEDGALPRDLKFYSFYGEIGLILEVRKEPDKKYCFYTPDGNIINTGKYSRKKLFEGNGFSDEALEKARKLSLEIPAPFVRIDYLDTGDGLVFGEFTPRPGGFGLINKNTDAMLGELFIAAETRLMNDLIDGKSFTNFSAIAYKE